MKVAARQKPHYVNNAEFSQSVVAYVMTVREAKDTGKPLPVVTDYIASCFLRIAEGLSHKSNFIRYTYREEMVMDAVENCLKAIENYNIEAATRTGKPNAFAYFTQISGYAFLRRISKEQHHQDIKFMYLSQSGIEEFMTVEGDNAQAGLVQQHFVDVLKGRIDRVKTQEHTVKEYAKKAKKKKTTDSDLQDFMT